MSSTKVQELKKELEFAKANVIETAGNFNYYFKTLFCFIAQKKYYIVRNSTRPRGKFGSN
jgi:hypothetical protein